MLARVSPPRVAPKTYADLLRCVEQTVLEGRRKIEDAWLRTYHDTGRFIHEHLLLNQDRADYGAKIIHRLALDTDIGKRTLYECVQLYRCFPIVRTFAQLSWRHYVLLCQVDDAKQRNSLCTAAAKEQWTVEQLTQRVRVLNAALTGGSPAAAAAAVLALPPPKLLTPRRGTPGLRAVVEDEEGLSVDLGLRVYRRLRSEQQRRLEKGAIVRLAADGSVRPEPDATKADLFTYDARVVRVVDGDTLVVDLALAPNLIREVKLRLRGLDCPELVLPEGRAAKRFVDARVAPGSELVIATSQADKYDRYLADVFLPAAAAEASGVAPDDYLNNALLAAGHAVRYDGSWPD